MFLFQRQPPPAPTTTPIASIAASIAPIALTQMRPESCERERRKQHSVMWGTTSKDSELRRLPNIVPPIFVEEAFISRIRYGSKIFLTTVNLSEFFFRLILLFD